MSFADNLVYLRQHYGVTQEALAEQLGVSRQTVSKWEAGINFPETDKLLTLCDLYHTNLDDLMRGSVRIANVHDTELYDAHMNRHSVAVAAIPPLVLVGVGLLIMLDASGFPSNLSTVVMFVFIILATIIGIVTGLGHTEFKRKHAGIDPRYSTDVLDRFGRRFTTMIAVGVGIILLDVIALIGFSPEHGDIVDLGFTTFHFDLFMGPFLFVLAIAVGVLVYAGMQKEKYDRSEITFIAKDGTVKANDPRTKTAAELKRDHILGCICGAIMILAVVIFLVWGFLPSLGDFASSGFDKFELKNYIRNGHGGFAVSWIAFPVGGLLCAVVCVIGSALFKTNDELIAEARKENPWVKVEGEEGAPETPRTSENPSEVQRNG